MPRIIFLIIICVFFLSSCDGLPVEIAITIIPAYTVSPTVDIKDEGTPIDDATKQPDVVESTPTAVIEDPSPTKEPPVMTESTQTLTMISTRVPSATPTNTATKTFIPTSTSTGTRTPTLTPTMEILPYKIQPESPVYMQNFANPDEGCDWLGVAGQVFDSSGDPQYNMVMVIEGELNGDNYELIGMTGTAGDYGPGGYEITISDEVFSSDNEISITLFDINGKQLSDPFWFTTYEDCERNLLLINFMQK